MKPMQGISVEPNFSWRIPGQRSAEKTKRWLELSRIPLTRLRARWRELLFTSLATVAIGGALLLTSYLFFIQLAAHGW